MSRLAVGALLACMVLGCQAVKRLEPELEKWLQKDTVGDTFETSDPNPNRCQRECVEGQRPMTCYYQFTIENYHTMGLACRNCPNVTSDCLRPQCVTADGYERGVYTVNRRLPGPSIQVCQGDRIIVDVMNMMPGRSTTIHWHGMFQEGSPHMDGVPMVTQCPIHEGEAFRYNFIGNHVGTHFWHSHDGLQKMDGIMGTLIVRQPRSRDPNANTYDHDLPAHYMLVADWMSTGADQKFPGTRLRDPGQDPQSYLINGRGRLPLVPPPSTVGRRKRSPHGHEDWFHERYNRQDGWGWPSPPVEQPSNQFGRPPAPPNNQYGRPPVPSNQYGRPPAPNNQYVKPPVPNAPYGGPPVPNNPYGGPPSPNNPYDRPPGSNPWQRPPPAGPVSPPRPPPGRPVSPPQPPPGRPASPPQPPPGRPASPPRPPPSRPISPPRPPPGQPPQQTAVPQTPYTEYLVTKGQRYRFRLIGGMCLHCPAQLSVDKHRMRLIATDGTAVRPVYVDHIVLLPGERFDIVIEANQNVGTYWIHIKGLGPCKEVEAHQVGLLRYAGSRLFEPSERHPGYEGFPNKGVTFNPEGVQCKPKGDSNDICVDELLTVRRNDNRIMGNPQVKLFFGFDFTTFSTEELFRVDTYQRFLQANARLQPGGPFTPVTVVSKINNVSFVNPPSPLLTQFNDIPKELLCKRGPQGYTGCDSDHCECVHVVNIPKDVLVEIIIADLAETPGDLHHPFHMHGHEFFVTSLGVFPPGSRGVAGVVALRDRTLDLTPIVQRLGEDEEGSFYPAKDTFQVPSAGYVGARFFADNPGYWMVHCHFIYHTVTGMSLVLNVGEGSHPPPPPNFPKCGDFRPRVG